MEIIKRVLDTTEKKVFDLMFTKKEFEKWLAKNNLEFNEEGFGLFLKITNEINQKNRTI